MLDSESLKLLPQKGVYTLLLYLSRGTLIQVGKLGFYNFRRGYYAYTGSALGKAATSLPKRVTRHLKRFKQKRHWHIDFLLANRNVTIVSVVMAQTDTKQECLLNQKLRQTTHASVPVKNFGSSDCKGLCEAHLLYFGEKNILPTILAIYRQKFNSHPFVLTLTGKTMPTFNVGSKRQVRDNAPSR
jgi:Uri superfamily endonuclease